MTKNVETTFSRVSTVVRNTFRVSPDQPITENTTSSDIDGWDSLSHAIFIMAIEDEFGIELSFDEANDVPNVGSLVPVIERELKAI
jgi:acyl carrier protein